MRIAVIMPCFLGDYPGAAKNREIKFMRAVNSFIDNKHDDKHLVIVSDGCDKTYNLYKRHYGSQSNIHCFKILKQPLFSGNVRQAGVEFAIKNIKADYICYLDSDDYLFKNHLQLIDIQAKGCDWVYFNDLLHPNKDTFQKRVTSLNKDFIGTSNIAHLAKKEYSWKNCNGYGHDFEFIKKMMALSKNYIKITCESYIVCHNPNLFDF